MRRSLSIKLVLPVSLTIISLTLSSASEVNSQFSILADSGIVTFQCATNMPGMEVTGKSSALTAHLEAIREPGRLVLRNIEALVAVRTLTTGIKVRDEHMRKYIFRDSEGNEPDLRFEGDQIPCESAGAREYRCSLTGTLSIRGLAKPFDTNLQVKEDASGVFHAAADGKITLSAYGIPQPSQFGVKPSNEVKIHLEFAAKTAPSARPANGGGE